MTTPTGVRRPAHPQLVELAAERDALRAQARR